MKKMNLKSLMFALVALFAASATMVFTSCGDDKDEPDSQSLIGQWEMTNVEEVYDEDENLSRVAIEFKTDGTYSLYTYEDNGEWYLWFTNKYTSTPIDPETKKGKITYDNGRNFGTMDYWFEGKQLVVQEVIVKAGKDVTCTYRYKRTSGIKPHVSK